MNCKIFVEKDAAKLALLRESVGSTHASTYPHSSYSIDIQNIFTIEVLRELFVVVGHQILFAETR